MTDSIVPKTSPFENVRAHVGQLDVHDVPELALGVVGDADLGVVAGQLDPFVILRKLHISRKTCQLLGRL